MVHTAIPLFITAFNLLTFSFGSAWAHYDPDNFPVSSLGRRSSSSSPQAQGPTTPPRKNPHPHSGPLMSVSGLSPLTPLPAHLESRPSTPPGGAVPCDVGLTFPDIGIERGPLMHPGSPLDPLTDSPHLSHVARCPPDEFWERGGCFSLQRFGQKTIRFTFQAGNNLELLQNMCRGMKLGNNGQTTNTAILTYRPRLKDDSAQIKKTKEVRDSAGCVTSYCRNIMDNGGLLGLEPEYDSCDEYPFASTMEGGDSRPLTQRSFVCIPNAQNCHQGGILRRLNGWQKGAQDQYKFLLSIDCNIVAQQTGGIYQPASLPYLQPPEPVSHLASREEYIFSQEDSILKFPGEYIDKPFTIFHQDGVYNSFDAWDSDADFDFD